MPFSGFSLKHIMNQNQELLQAALKGDRKLVEEFLTQTTCSQQDRNKALIYASQVGNLEIVQLLIEYQAEIDYQLQPHRISPLMAAAAKNREQVLEFLISHILLGN